MIFSFSFGNPNKNQFKYANKVNPGDAIQARYMKLFGQPQSAIDIMKLREYEKSMKDIMIVKESDIKMVNEEEKNIDNTNKDPIILPVSDISGNQV